MILRTNSLNQFKGSMTRHEHAVMVTKLLKAQSFDNPPWAQDGNPDDAEISPTVQETLLRKLRFLVKEHQSKNPQQHSILLSSLIQPGTLVTTHNANIAPLGPVKVSRHVCYEEYGNMISESKYFPGYWLVNFYNLKQFDYVASSFLKYVSSASVTKRYKSPKTSGGVLEWEDVQTKANNRDLIILCILNSKIHCSEGSIDMSVSAIANLFSRYFPFMTQNKIQQFVNKYCAKIQAAKYLMLQIPV